MAAAAPSSLPATGPLLYTPPLTVARSAHHMIWGLPSKCATLGVGEMGRAGCRALVQGLGRTWPPPPKATLPSLGPQRPTHSRFQVLKEALTEREAPPRQCLRGLQEGPPWAFPAGPRGSTPAAWPVWHLPPPLQL